MLFFSWTQKTHIATSSKKCLLCHKCIVLYTLYSTSFSFARMQGVPHITLVYFLNFLAQFKKCITDKCSGSMVKWKASLIMSKWARGWRPWAGHSTSPNIGFLLGGHQRSSCSSRFLQLSGGSWGTQSLWALMALLNTCLFLKASHPGLCHLLIVRRLFRKGNPHRSHRTSNNGGHLCIGGTTRTTLISSHLKGFLPYTALKPVESSLRACLTSHAIFVVISTDWLGISRDPAQLTMVFRRPLANWSQTPAPCGLLLWVTGTPKVQTLSWKHVYIFNYTEVLKPHFHIQYFWAFTK